MFKVSLKRLLAGAFLLSFPVTSLWADPGALQVIGNAITVPSYGGCTIRLKGVNVDGMEFDPSGGQGPASGGITANLAEAVTAWNANIVRVPMNQDYWFGCGGNDEASYQNIIQEIVDYCDAHNVYVLLDLHWSGTQTGATSPCSGAGWGNAKTANCSGSCEQYMPDDNSVTFWSSVAATYANNPAVLFDLFNEPYDYDGNGWTIWRDGGTGTGANNFHTPGMQTLLNTVRAAGANNVVVMGGLDYAYNLTQVTGYPVTNMGEGVIYSTHIYPFKGSNPWTTADGDSDLSIVSASVPILVGEFGQGNSITNYTPNPDTNGTWDQTLLQWIDLHGYSATAWDMHINSCPCLLQSDWVTPTSFHGVPVKNWLATPQPTCVYTPTFTYTPTPCGYPGNTCTPTDTPTPTATSTPTATPNPNVDRPFPNPWPSIDNPNQPPAVYHNITSQPDFVRLKLYTTAFRKVLDLGGFDPTVGQHLYTLDPSQLNSLADGLYYLVVAEERGGQESRTVLKFLIRR